MGAAAAMLAAVLLLTPITVPAGYPGAVAPATAACPDAEVVFARGRFEPPGIGTVGNAFVSALRSKVNKNVGVYAVKYPADNQIDVGANDMSAHIQSMANKLSEYPPGARRLLAGRGRHRRGTRGAHPDVGLHQSPASRQ